MFPGASVRFGVYQIAARVFPVAVDTAHVLVVSFPGRQNEWMSSATATVEAGSPFWFQPIMQTSQFPAVGVPEPPPTEVPAVSAIGVDCNAGAVVPNVFVWLKLPAHEFTRVTARTLTLSVILRGGCAG